MPFSFLIYEKQTIPLIKLSESQNNESILVSLEVHNTEQQNSIVEVNIMKKDHGKVEKLNYQANMLRINT